MQTDPQAFVWLAILSILLWTLCEIYNMSLAAWYHAGLPQGPVRYLWMGWSFACIWPAIYETADLLMASSVSSRNWQLNPDRARFSGWEAVRILAGIVCLLIPVVVPRLDLGEHLFVLVGVGFLLLLDPLNRYSGRPSVWQDFLRGRHARNIALMLSCVLCGLFAEALNHFLEVRWFVIADLGTNLRFFELPLPAYAVLHLFGLQAFVLHVFAAGSLELPIVELPSPNREP